MISLVIIYLFLLDSVSIIDTGAGSLLLEFGILSRLLGDPTFEGVARRTNRALWEQRDPITGLLGNLINVQTAEWVGVLSGLGASLDSFFEYMLKAYVLFGEPEDYKMFNESYSAIQKHLRKGRDICHLGYGDPPIYVNGNMRDGSILNTWIDSLQAAFIGVQVLYGEVSEAMCMHALYYSIWKKFGLMPERFNWKLKAADVGFYPLRPEFIESTYFLYQATKNPFYLHVGKEILQNLNTYTRTSCGFATVHSVEDMSHEDRMESFVLAETFKYLFLLFDVDNPVNKHYEKFLFSTEGHLFPIRKEFHTGSSHWPKSAAETLAPRPSVQPSTCPTVKPSTSVPANKENAPAGDTVVVVAQPVNRSSVVEKCDNFPFPRFALPMDSHYFRQMDLFVGHPVSYSGSSEMLHYCQSS